MSDEVTLETAWAWGHAKGVRDSTVFGVQPSGNPFRGDQPVFPLDEQPQHEDSAQVGLAWWAGEWERARNVLAQVADLMDPFAYDELWLILSDNPVDEHGEAYRPRPFPLADIGGDRTTTPVSVLDDVWCLTCNHAHIATIQTVTFYCAPRCGFGAWDERVAVEHATTFPDHIVHPVHHQTVPYGWRPDPEE